MCRRSCSRRPRPVVSPPGENSWNLAAPGGSGCGSVPATGSGAIRYMHYRLSKRRGRGKTATVLRLAVLEAVNRFAEVGSVCAPADHGAVVVGFAHVPVTVMAYEDQPANHDDCLGHKPNETIAAVYERVTIEGEFLGRRVVRVDADAVNGPSVTEV